MNHESSDMDAFLVRAWEEDLIAISSLAATCSDNSVNIIGRAADRPAGRDSRGHHPSGSTSLPLSYPGDWEEQALQGLNVKGAANEAMLIPDNLSKQLQVLCDGVGEQY